MTRLEQIRARVAAFPRSAAALFAHAPADLTYLGDEVARLRAALEKFAGHNLDAECSHSIESVSEHALSPFTQIGAYYIGRRTAWEDIQNIAREALKENPNG